MNKKKGFTLVELLVVIAILAILATVSVIGYLSFTDKAKNSNDESLVTQLNTVLQGNEALNGKPSTMYEALEQVEEAGFNVEKLTPTNVNNEFVWNQETNRFQIISADSLNSGDVSPNLWVIVDDEETMNVVTERYSVYLADEFIESGDKTINVKNGFDTGSYENIDIVNLTNEANNEYIVRTTTGELNVNTPNATVKHYGELSSANIEAVSNNSYHEYGKVINIKLNSGNLIVEANSNVNMVYITGNNSKLTVDSNSNKNISVVKKEGIEVEVNLPSDFESVKTEIAINTFNDLETAINSSNDIFVRLEADIVFEKTLTISNDKTFNFNTNGKSITANSNFSKGRLFDNYGWMSIIGEGNIDITAAGANGLGTVNNHGVLSVYDGSYKNLKESNGSNFYNRNGGTAYFYDVKIYGGGGCVATETDAITEIHGGYYHNETYPTIENRGIMLITAGDFVNTSCSSCDSRWGYTVRSGESSSNAYLKINGKTETSVNVTGVQGGLAVIGGTADIYNGNYETVACETHGDGSSFYAGYFTGESYKTSTTIYGGTFKSVSKTAVLVGNGNPNDGGVGEESTIIVYGGTFIGGDASKTAIKVENQTHAIGAAKLFGGFYSSNPENLVDENYEVILLDNGLFEVRHK